MTDDPIPPPTPVTGTGGANTPAPNGSQEPPRKVKLPLPQKPPLPVKPSLRVKQETTNSPAASGGLEPQRRAKSSLLAGRETGASSPNGGYAPPPRQTRPSQPAEQETELKPPLFDQPGGVPAADFVALLNKRYALIPDGRYRIEMLPDGIAPFRNSWKAGVDFVVGIVEGEFAGKEIPLSLTTEGEGTGDGARRPRHDDAQPMDGRPRHHPRQGRRTTGPGAGRDRLCRRLARVADDRLREPRGKPRGARHAGRRGTRR